MTTTDATTTEPRTMMRGLVSVLRVAGDYNRIRLYAAISAMVALRERHNDGRPQSESTGWLTNAAIVDTVRREFGHTISENQLTSWIRNAEAHHRRTAATLQGLGVDLVDEAAEASKIDSLLNSLDNARKENGHALE